MKKCVSLILLIMMLFDSSAAYAGEIQEESVQYGYILCDERIDNETIQLDVMIKNNNIYVNAAQIREVSGCAVEVTDEHVHLTSPHRVEVYFYHDSRKVVYIPPFLDWVFEYEAPFESICENGMGWIPLEYTLLILNEQWRVLKDTLYIEEHSKSMLDEFSDMKMSEEYGYFSTTPFTLFKDNQKLMNKVATAARAANLFNGLISLEPNSWGNIFTGALCQSDYFIDMKYGDKITKMLCITSEEENDEMIDNIGTVYDIASSDGTFGSILQNMDTALDSKVDYAMKRLERVRSEFKKGNLSEYCLNKASQELDIAMDAQERFLKTGGIVLNVQNELTELSPKLQIADQTFTGLEILSGIIEISGYATEFCSRDKFVAKALDTYIHHKSENGGISGGFDRAMVVQKDALNSNIAAYSAYEFFKSHFVDCADRLFQWGNPIWLELQLSQFAWSFISSHIPFFSEGLKETDSFETALYATALENDAKNAFAEYKNYISKSEKNITSENLYKLVQLAYVYLKTSDVVQNATVAAFRDFSEENTEVINKHCRIIAKKIAALKKVEQYYGQENFGLVFGFLPECNKAYLEKYDPNVFRDLVYEVDESPLDRTFILPESNSRVYEAEELRALSKEQLELARNEIFARRGRIFKREDLQQYFEGKFWYLPCIEPDEFDDQTMLSDIEKKNLDLINGIERENSYMTVYQNFLKEHPAIWFGDEYYDASFSNEDTTYINEYILHDINGDTLPELFTATYVNFRWEIYHIYTIDNGSVVPMMFDDGSEAIFDDCHTANGGYDFYICEQKHIHNVYSGGFQGCEEIYTNENGRLKLVLLETEERMDPVTLEDRNIFNYYYNNIEIGKEEYVQKTAECRPISSSWISNVE